MTDGRVFGPFLVPRAAMNLILDGRIVGTQYFVGDAFAWDGSSYYVLHDHVATASLDADLGAGHIRALASKAIDAETYRGVYSNAVAYPKSSLVQKDGIIWKNFVNVAAGGTLPGAPMSSWGVSLFLAVPAAYVQITAEKKTLGVVIAELRTEITNLKNRVTTLEAA